MAIRGTKGWIFYMASHPLMIQSKICPKLSKKGRVYERMFSYLFLASRGKTFNANHLWHFVAFCVPSAVPFILQLPPYLIKHN